ncbi:MAG: DUF167 domain-containing protein [Alphaproteobacteria bacterium]|nr:DUF167 domain-containing protein [Alphaproteobacteria bacterium]
MPSTFYRPADHRTRLFVRLTPKARAERIEGTILDGDGQLRLKIAVTAPPEDGKANASLIACLAKRLKIAKSAIQLESGATSRLKTLVIEGAADDMSAKLDALVD